MFLEWHIVKVLGVHRGTVVAFEECSTMAQQSKFVFVFVKSTYIELRYFTKLCPVGGATSNLKKSKLEGYIYYSRACTVFLNQRQSCCLIQSKSKMSGAPSWLNGPLAPQLPNWVLLVTVCWGVGGIDITLRIRSTLLEEEEGKNKGNAPETQHRLTRMEWTLCSATESRLPEREKICTIQSSPQPSIQCVKRSRAMLVTRDLQRELFCHLAVLLYSLSFNQVLEKICSGSRKQFFAGIEWSFKLYLSTKVNVFSLMSY